MSFVVSLGSYGGFYWYSGFSKRLVLGWVYFTFFPVDDDFLGGSLDYMKLMYARKNSGVAK